MTGQTLTEAIADSRTPPPEEQLLHESERKRVSTLVDSLDDREAKILRLRYGLDGNDPMTLKEIGKKIDLTRERVRQIENVALSKIKEHLEE